MGQKLVSAAELGGNPDFKPAWGPPAERGITVFGNPKFGLVLHLVVVDDVTGKPLYDTMMRAEQGGGVFLPVDRDGNVYLQQMVRNQTRDQAAWAKAWPNVDVGSLGRVSWEIPRGFAKTGESGAEAAKREAQEETGHAVTEAAKLCEVNDNTAMSPHMTAVQVGFIDLTKRAPDGSDPNEVILKKIRPFTRLELAELIRKGELYCSYTLSAIGVYLLTKDM